MEFVSYLYASLKQFHFLAWKVSLKNNVLQEISPFEAIALSHCSTCIHSQVITNNVSQLCFSLLQHFEVTNIRYYSYSKMVAAMVGIVVLLQGQG